jgi:hypothetical protein
LQGDQFQAPAPKPAVPETDTDMDAYLKDKSASDDEMTSLKDMLAQRTASAKGQKEIDAYMSLLQAGLGMMSGTSPYAMANIGKGASTGLQYAMDARKQQIAEENAILSGRLGLSRAELLEKSRQNALKRQIDLDRQNAMFKSLGLQNQSKLIGLKEQQNISKAEADMVKEGAFDTLEADYAKQYGKNWKQDAVHKADFDRERLAKIRQRASGYSADANLGISNASDLLK